MSPSSSDSARLKLSARCHQRITRYYLQWKKRKRRVRERFLPVLLLFFFFFTIKISSLIYLCICLDFRRLGNLVSRSLIGSLDCQIKIKFVFKRCVTYGSTPLRRRWQMEEQTSSLSARHVQSLSRWENLFDRHDSSRARLTQTAFAAQTCFLLKRLPLPWGDGEGSCIFMTAACIVMSWLRTGGSCTH